ncbi:DUF4129 domain-containing protein [Microcoleus sp. ARI1-B5]|uniref:DUF4129 domain-containing protein n=1 Tax=unclassified Microcoleus TaxID=2642155 RepID=UPI002FCED750
MPESSFDKTNVNWQVGQLQQRIQEWWELKTPQNTPNIKFPTWFDSPIWWAMAQAAFWLIVTLLAVWATWQIWQLLRFYIHNFKKRNQTTDASAKKTSQDLSVAEWLLRSQKLQQKAKYRQACRCLYMAVLQRLNDGGIAVHQPSRTDGEYLQLIQELPQRGPYETVIAIHEQLYFGNTEASPSIFEQCQQAYQQIKD